MKDKMNQKAGWILLCIAAMPFLLLIWLLIHQQIIRHKMPEKLEKDHLHTVTLTSDQFFWNEPGKEIRIQGELFDVKSFTVKGEYYFFTGLFDKEESNIENWLAQSSSGQTEQNKRSLQQIFELLEYICHPKIFALSVAERIINNLPAKSRKHFNLPHIYLNIPTPPPEFLF